MPTLFISDLHLDAARPRMTRIFLRFLSGPARSAERVYIMGDLFDLWIGDDANMAHYPAEIAALRDLSDSGVPLYLMHGNRDFLIGDAFLKATGGKLLKDPTVIDLNGAQTVLSHGDMLCTDDIAHMKGRQEWLDPVKQAAFLAQPPAVREKIARQLRMESSHNKTLKTAEIMDVTQKAVVDLLRQYRVRQLIHGHTHRPAIHDFELDGAAARRIVLSDWHEDHGSMLICDEAGCRLQDLY
ncbi:MAG: UDP-2,3-diacylglucosamine diphosphatase [Nevskiales bacterium]